MFLVLACCQADFFVDRVGGGEGGHAKICTGAVFAEESWDGDEVRVSGDCIC